MSTSPKKRIGGGLILLVAGWLGRDTIAWAIGKGWDVATQRAPTISWTAFPWENSLVAVLALVGAYLAFWPSHSAMKAGRKKTPLAEQFYLLWSDADDFVRRVRYQRGLEWWECQRGIAEPTPDIARDGISLLVRFQKAGLPIPIFDTNSAEKIALGCAEYFSSLLAYMRDGHTEHVMASAPGAKTCAENAARAFDPNHWLIRSVQDPL